MSHFWPLVENLLLSINTKTIFVFLKEVESI